MPTTIWCCWPKTTRATKTCRKLVTLGLKWFYYKPRIDLSCCASITTAG